MWLTQPCSRLDTQICDGESRIQSEMNLHSFSYSSKVLLLHGIIRPLEAINPLGNYYSVFLANPSHFYVKWDSLNSRHPKSNPSQIQLVQAETGRTST